MVVWVVVVTGRVAVVVSCTVVVVVGGFCTVVHEVKANSIAAGIINISLIINRLALLRTSSQTARADVFGVKISLLWPHLMLRPGGSLKPINQHQALPR